MSLNAQIMQIVQSQTIEDISGPAEQALRAISRAALHEGDNAAKAAALRQAIRDRRDYWKGKIPAPTLTDTIIDSNEAADFIDPADANNSPTNIWQKATEMLVVKGLDKLSKDQLETLFHDNSPRLRRELLENAPISAHIGLTGHPAIAAQRDDVLLPADSLTNIASKAAVLYIQKYGKDYYEVNRGLIGPELLDSANHLFVENLPHPLEGQLTEEAIPTVKRILAEYIIKEHIKYDLPPEQSIGIALTQDITALKNSNLGANLSQEVKDLAIRENNAVELRSLAAVNAFNRQLLSTYNKAALEAITRAADGTALAKALADHPVLGFATPEQEAFRNFIKDLVPLHTNSIKMTANIRKHLLDKANPELLVECIRANAPDVMVTLVNAQSNQPIPTNELQEHFSDSWNMLVFRKQALLQVAKHRFETMDVRQQLTPIVRAANDNDLIPLISRMLGDQRANDLVAGPPDAGFNKILRAHAYAVALAKHCDLRINNVEARNRLLTDINSPGNKVELQNIPTTELHQIQIRLTKALLQTQNFEQLQAQRLITAKTEAEFKTALTDIGITAQDWVDVDSMKALQQVIAAKNIAALVNNASSHFDASMRPELVKLLASLPFESQQQLTENPRLIPAILSVPAGEKGFNKFIRILNIDPLSSPEMLEQLEKMAAEFRTIRACQNIHNAEIAKCLATIRPPLDLTPEVIGGINRLLAPWTDNDFRGPNNYAQRIADIRGIMHPQPDAESFHRAFGLNPADNANLTIENPTQSAIIQQQSFNRELYFELDDNYPPERNAFISFLLSLKKDENLTVGTADARGVARLIVANMVNMPDYAQFISSLDTVQGLGDVTKTSLKQSMTPDKFYELRGGYVKRNFITHTRDALERSRDILDSINSDALTELDELGKDKFEYLEHLAKSGNLSWLSPEFQASAKQDALKLKRQLEPLAKSCADIVRLYEQQRDKVDRLLNSLPNDAEIRAAIQDRRLDRNARKEIEAHRTELQDKRKELHAGWALYNDLKLRFDGRPGSTDPFWKKGLLKVLDEAIKGGRVIQKFAGYDCEAADYPVAEKQVKFKAALAPVPVQLEGVIRTDDKYLTKEKVEEGYYREYTVTLNRGQRFKIQEEPQKDEIRTDKKGDELIHDNVKFSVQPNIPRGQTTEVLSTAELAEKYFIVALQIVKNKGPNSVIDLRGTDQQVQYVWSALMLIGKDNPHLNINKNTINCMSQFDPYSHTTLLGNPKGSAVDAIRALPMYKMSKGNVKELQDNMHKTDEKDRSKLMKAAKEQVALGKELSGEVGKKIASEAEKEEPTIRPFRP